MGRKRNPENKTRVEDIRAKLENSKQNKVAQVPMDEQSVRTAFSEFWAKARKAYNRPRELESILWAHLKSTGNDKPDLFEAGLKHFGLKK